MRLNAPVSLDVYLVMGAPARDDVGRQRGRHHDGRSINRALGVEASPSGAGGNGPAEGVERVVAEDLEK